jgi:RimJ/RimL family protein N-acetyltransferase
MPDDVVLREVRDDDLPIFFAQQLDPEANWMAAFTPRDPSDREAFMEHWAKIRADGTIALRTILFAGQVAGSIVCFSDFGEPEVGYWLGKEYWGKGIATRALAAFLRLISERPLGAHVAKDNAASLRVLQKCGFVITGAGAGFSPARGQQVEEFALTLADEPDAISEMKASDDA